MSYITPFRAPTVREVCRVRTYKRLLTGLCLRILSIGHISENLVRDLLMYKIWSRVEDPIPQVRWPLRQTQALQSPRRRTRRHQGKLPALYSALRDLAGIAGAQ